MQYIEDQWKYASFVGAGIIVMLSFILAFALGKYHLILPYLVPEGNATRA